MATYEDRRIKCLEAIARGLYEPFANALVDVSLLPVAPQWVDVFAAALTYKRLMQAKAETAEDLVYSMRPETYDKWEKELSVARSDNKWYRDSHHGDYTMGGVRILSLPSAEAAASRRAKVDEVVALREAKIAADFKLWEAMRELNDLNEATLK